MLFRDGVHSYRQPPSIGSVPSLSGHAINCVPIAFTAESPPAQASSAQGIVPVTDAAFSGITMDILCVYLLDVPPHPLLVP